MTLPWAIILFLVLSPILIPLLGLTIFFIKILIDFLGFLFLLFGIFLFFVPAFIIFALFRGLLLMVTRFGWWGILFIITLVWLLNLI